MSFSFGVISYMNYFIFGAMFLILPFVSDWMMEEWHVSRMNRPAQYACAKNIFFSGVNDVM